MSGPRPAGDWARVRAIFERAVGLTGEDREAYLASACDGDPELLARVREILAGHETSNTLLDGGPQVALGDVVDAPDELGPRALDGYRLVEKIGEGGMGEVWLATQSEPLERRVALKIIKRGMDSERVIARFDTERQALARMDHPAIARVFDAGTTPGGRPYFAMEYVEGEPIVAYCERAGLSIRQRLALFARVCEGVQHAHHKGIIHRDLKPSNVLVTERDDHAVPKIIDFGIAKATDPRRAGAATVTELGVLVGTPEYMSPEQTDMTGHDVDTRSDVYSLGVLLYELLTGMLPFEPGELRRLAFDEICRRIREDVPTRPSLQVVASHPDAAGHGLARRLRGDLDWIVLRAMEKDRARRYGSPAELAEDIRRHLQNQPVLAGPPGAAYRVGKFVRRHRAGVAIGAALTLLLLGFATTTTLQNRRIARSAAELEQMLEFQSAQLTEVSVEQMGAQFHEALVKEGRSALLRDGATDAERAGFEQLVEVLPRLNFTDVSQQVLDRSIFQPTLARIDRQLADRPLVRARLMHSIASTMLELWLLESAVGPQEEALRIRREVLGEAHPETIESLETWATLQYHFGEKREALAALNHALEIAIGALGPDHPVTLELAVTTQEHLMGSGAMDAAAAMALDTLERSRRALGNDHPVTILAERAQAGTFQTMGRLHEAAKLVRGTIAASERVHGANHGETLEARSALAGTLWLVGDLDEAEALMRENLRRIRATFGEDHPRTLQAVTDLATLLETSGRFAEAEPLLRRAMELATQALGPYSVTTTTALHNLGFVEYKLGRLDDAAESIAMSLARRRTVLDPGDPAVVGNMGNLAMVWAAQGRGEEAEELARQALEAGTGSLGPGHWLVANTRGQLGLALAAQGRYAEARHEYEAAYASLGGTLGENSERTQRVAGYLADLPDPD